MVYISQGADGLQGSPGTEGPQGLDVSVACFFCYLESELVSSHFQFLLPDLIFIRTK